MTAAKSSPEAWAALRSIAADLSAGRMPNAEDAKWFADTVGQCKEDDHKRLARELGLLVYGRRLTVNPKIVADAVASLVVSGTSIMIACDKVAKSLGCNSKTAHRWYTQRRSIGNA